MRHRFTAAACILVGLLSARVLSGATEGGVRMLVIREAGLDADGREVFRFEESDEIISSAPRRQQVNVEGGSRRAVSEQRESSHERVRLSPALEERADQGAFLTKALGMK